jgi:glycosyltransferase involved in cell wall biosynthesis
MGGERYFSLGIATFIAKNRPQVLIGFSLYPTTLLGMMIGRLLGSKTIVFADTWLGRDQSINHIQKFVRRVLYRLCGDAFLGASRQTLQMFKHYRPELKDNQLFLSHLCSDNDHFIESLKGKAIERKFDILFSGRISAEKNPLFFADVAVQLNKRIGDLRVLILGDGDPKLRDEMFHRLHAGNVSYEWPGFIPNQELPQYYAQAKVFLMPSLGDCWGVVLNEAMICGLPVITTEWTAAAGELVTHNENGLVLPLDVNAWTESVERLLTDEKQWNHLSLRASEDVKQFNFQEAAQGIIDAIGKLKD